MGRFVSADGFVAGISGSLQGYNLFVYCFNNPVNGGNTVNAYPYRDEKTGKKGKYYGISTDAGIAWSQSKGIGLSFSAGIDHTWGIKLFNFYDIFEGCCSAVMEW